MLFFLLGVLAGVAIALWSLAFYSVSDQARRSSALHRAYQRVSDAQTTALMGMALAIEDEVATPEASAHPSAPRTWPSERAQGDGEIVTAVVVPEQRTGA